MLLWEFNPLPLLTGRRVFVNGKVLFCTFVGGELSAGVLKLNIDLLAGHNPFALAVLKFISVINC